LQNRQVAEQTNCRTDKVTGKLKNKHKLQNKHVKFKLQNRQVAGQVVEQTDKLQNKQTSCRTDKLQNIQVAEQTSYRTDELQNKASCRTYKLKNRQVAEQTSWKRQVGDRVVQKSVRRQIKVELRVNPGSTRVKLENRDKSRVQLPKSGKVAES
jgi:ribosomal protein S30